MKIRWVSPLLGIVPMEALLVPNKCQKKARTENKTTKPRKNIIIQE